jgi:hypothetical protein
MRNTDLEPDFTSSQDLINLVATGRDNSGRLTPDYATHLITQLRTLMWNATTMHEAQKHSDAIDSIREYQCKGVH